jgi:hypothetical protein
LGSNPSIYITDPAQASNSRVWRIMNQGTQLRFYKQDDGESGFLGALCLDRVGNVLVAARLQIGGGSSYAMSVSYPAWRNTGADMECVTGDNSQWATVRAARFVSTGVSNNFADFTCTGATNFQGGVSVSAGGATIAGPVRAATDWFYNNGSATGLYNAALGMHFAADGTYWSMAFNNNGAGGIRFFQNWGGTIRGYIHWDGNGFGLLNSGGGWAFRIDTANNLRCSLPLTQEQGMYLYPGAVTASGNQTAWYLATHSSFGLYSNTGFYLESGVWCSGIACRGDISCTTCTPSGNINCSGIVDGLQGLLGRAGSGGTGGQQYSYYWTGGAMNAYVGTAYVGQVAGLSDARLKTHIETIPSALAALKRLRPVTFEWAETLLHAEAGIHYGLIGQEVEAELPDVVRRLSGGVVGTPDDARRVNYQALIPLLIRAVQELSAEIAELRSDRTVLH